jgi:hypothetical protein
MIKNNKLINKIKLLENYEEYINPLVLYDKNDRLGYIVH